MSDQHAWQKYDDVMSALEEFYPRPSEQFYRRMQSEPWITVPKTTHLNVLRQRRFNQHWLPAVSILAVLLVAGTVLVTPPLRAMAQELVGLFMRDRRDVVLEQQLEADISPVETWHFELSRAEAEREAGFDVWSLRHLPDGYRFSQAVYMPAEQMVMSMYTNAPASVADPRGHPGFVLAQQPAAQAGSSGTFRVGASAVIETVQIGDVKGEYVEGGWCGPSSEEPMQWCPGDFAQTLRWQRGDWVFTLDASDNTAPGQERPSISREQMIDMAAQVAPAVGN
jgi:hypothetical protein